MIATASVDYPGLAFRRAGIPLALLVLLLATIFGGERAANSNGAANTADRSATAPSFRVVPLKIPALLAASEFTPMLPELTGEDLEDAEFYLDEFLGDDPERATDARHTLLQGFDCRVIARIDARLAVTESDSRREMLEALRAKVGRAVFDRADDTSMLPHVTIHPDGRIELDAILLSGVRQLEFLLCGPRGKQYESVFLFPGSARDIATLLGDRDVRDPGIRPREAGDWLVYEQGQTYTMTVLAGARTYTLGAFVRDIGIGAPLEPETLSSTPTPADSMGRAAFAYLGLRESQQHSLPDERGSFIDLFAFPSSLFAFVGDGAGDETRFIVRDDAPVKGPVAVRLILTPEATEIRDARNRRRMGAWHRANPGRSHPVPGIDRRDPTVPVAQSPRDRAAPPGTEFASLMPALDDDTRARLESAAWDLVGTTPEERAVAQRVFDAADCRAVGAVRFVRDSVVERLSAMTLSDSRRREMFAARDTLDELWETLADRPFVDAGVTYFPGTTIDPERRAIWVDGQVAPFGGWPLEYLVCGPRGKGHESVVMLFGRSKHVDEGLKQFGLSPATERPSFKGDWLLYDGDSVTIEVSWLDSEEEGGDDSDAPENWWDDPRVTTVRLEELMIDRETEAPVAKTGFAYTGGVYATDGTSLGDEFGTIVSSLSDPYCVLQNPWLGAGVMERYVVNVPKLPAQGTPLRLTIRPEPKAERDARREQLRPEWERVLRTRPSIDVVLPDGWWPHPRERLLYTPQFPAEMSEDARKNHPWAQWSFNIFPESWDDLAAQEGFTVASGSEFSAEYRAMQIERLQRTTLPSKLLDIPLTAEFVLGGAPVFLNVVRRANDWYLAVVVVRTAGVDYSVFMACRTDDFEGEALPVLESFLRGLRVGREMDAPDPDFELPALTRTPRIPGYPGKWWPSNDFAVTIEPDDWAVSFRATLAYAPTGDTATARDGWRLRVVTESFNDMRVFAAHAVEDATEFSVVDRAFLTARLGDKPDVARVTPAVAFSLAQTPALYVEAHEADGWLTLVLVLRLEDEDVTLMLRADDRDAARAELERLLHTLRVGEAETPLDADASLPEPPPAPPREDESDSDSDDSRNAPGDGD